MSVHLDIKYHALQRARPVDEPVGQRTMMLWTHARMHIRSHVRTHARTHACSYTHTHACTHTHTHARILVFLLKGFIKSPYLAVISRDSQQSPSIQLNFIHLDVRYRALERARPVDESVGAVYVPRVVESYEGFSDGSTHGRIHREAHARPV